jgi:hypothetical protein
VAGSICSTGDGTCVPQASRSANTLSGGTLGIAPFHNALPLDRSSVGHLDDVIVRPCRSDPSQTAQRQQEQKAVDA